jgi:cystathionine beta-lyase/cystathionine gamma-synthase
MNISEIINSLGEDRELYFNSVSAPLILSSNFAFPTIEAFREGMKSEMDTPFYTRGHNPTVAILRKKIAALEHAEDCLMFSSGSGAVAAAVMSQLKAGDHVVSVLKPYSWTYKLLTKLLKRFGVESTFVDGTNPQNFADACQANTKVFMLESPNSMTFEMQDLKAISAIAKARGIVTIIDNTYASPLLQQPILHGIDIVVQSATKYLNGHSDVVAGAVCASRAICETIFEQEYMTLGSVLSAQDAWLILRGLRTMPIRIKQQGETTSKVVAYLEQHPKILKVNFPGSATYEQNDLYNQYLSAPSALFSVQIDAPNLEAIERFCNSLQHFLMGVSFGSYESLIYPVCVLYTSANYSTTTLPWNMIRVSVGLEDAEMLIQDMEQALAKM